MKGDFNTDNATGKVAERAIARTLAAKGHTITDCSGIRAYQQKDIDFLLERNGKTASLEVKNEIRSEGVCPNRRGNWRRGKKAEKHLNALVRQIPV